jgi:hypothetical protein
MSAKTTNTSTTRGVTLYGLGRKVQHDPQSRRFAVTTTPTELRTVRHTHYGPVLDQGNLGACTGYAITQWLNCHPAHKPRSRALQGDKAVSLYSRATQVDPWDGWYNPATGVEDTGSSGLAVCKAAQEAGLIGGYRWIFGGVAQLAAALQDGPVLAGTVWLDGMFAPSLAGWLNVSGSPVGGHEYVIVGYNRPSRYFTMLNSWGEGWGRGGFARIREDKMQTLLDAQGDLTVPVL